MKNSFKRKIYLFFAAAPLLFKKWTIRKKLHMSFLSLILILGLNALLTSYEIARLKEHHLNLSYLVYLDVLGVVSGVLFIWIISSSVVRPMKKIIERLESKDELEPAAIYGSDELGKLARAISFMKKDQSSLDGTLDMKNRMIEVILDHAIDGIFIFDSDGRIVSYSQSFKTISGYDDEEIHSKMVDEIIPEINLSEIDQVLDTDKNQFYKKDKSILQKSGKSSLIECSICPIKSEGQNLYIGIIRCSQKRSRLRRFIDNFTQKDTR